MASQHMSRIPRWWSLRDINIIKSWDCPYALCSYVTHGQLNVDNSKYSIRTPASAMRLCRMASWPLAAAGAEEHMEKELERLLDPHYY